VCLCIALMHALLAWSIRCACVAGVFVHCMRACVACVFHKVRMCCWCVRALHPCVRCLRGPKGARVLLVCSCVACVRALLAWSKRCMRVACALVHCIRACVACVVHKVRMCCLCVRALLVWSRRCTRVAFVFVRCICACVACVIHKVRMCCLCFCALHACMRCLCGPKGACAVCEACCTKSICLALCADIVGVHERRNARVTT